MNVVEITYDELSRLDESGYILADIRGRTAFENGHIPNAVLWEDVFNCLPENKAIILYCAVGERSREFAEKLMKQGFNAKSLAGGYRQWLARGFDGLSDNELMRYDRQIILSEIGDKGQQKLKNSSALIVGAGGLGSPAALYLAGAGVGRLGVIDGDVVSISNLQRQILHKTSLEGKNKALSAKETLLALNPEIEITAYPFSLTPKNAENLISEYDFIIDGSDNFETKFLINDVCVLLDKPFCFGGILRFDGQVMTYVPENAPCLRCVFEDIPTDVPNCSQAGVIGAIAGIVGSIQALECIKYLTGAGELLSGKLWTINALSMQTRTINIRHKNPNCLACNISKSELRRRISELPVPVTCK